MEFHAPPLSYAFFKVLYHLFTSFILGVTRGAGTWSWDMILAGQVLPMLLRNPLPDAYRRTHKTWIKSIFRKGNPRKMDGFRAFHVNLRGIPSGNGEPNFQAQRLWAYKTGEG